MVYATSSDAIDLYGEDYILTSVDRDFDGVADPTAINDALEQATSELDSYIGVRYDLPLAVVPAVLVRFCIDIAVYVASPNAAELTEEKEARYKAAIAWAKGVAKGSVSLGTVDVPASVTENNGLGSIQTNYAVSTRIFDRTKMSGIL